MTDHLERDIRAIRYKVDGIDKSVDLLLRANRKEIVDDLLDFFGKSKDRINVFLTVDGERTVNQVTAKLRPMKQPNVSSRISELVKEGLIYVKKTTKEGIIYDKTDKVKILNLEKSLKKKFKIN